MEKKVKEKLATKQKKLEKIMNSEWPIDSRHDKTHERKVFNAKLFLKELEEIMSVVETDLNVKIVPRPTFEKQIEKADFATMEFDGEFCKIAIVENFPNDSLWLVYTMPVDLL